MVAVRSVALAALFSLVSCATEKDVQDMLSGLDGLMDLFGGEDGTCTFKCPNSGEVRRPNPKHKPSSNGCGAFGIDVTSDIPGQEYCCDIHDYCYDTCNQDKKMCDENFKTCLEGLCEERVMAKKEKQNCKLSAQIMHAYSSTMGCGPYKKSQKNACICEKQKHTDL